MLMMMMMMMMFMLRLMALKLHRDPRKRLSTCSVPRCRFNLAGAFILVIVNNSENIHQHHHHHHHLNHLFSFLSQVWDLGKGSGGGFSFLRARSKHRKSLYLEPVSEPAVAASGTGLRMVLQKCRITWVPNEDALMLTRENGMRFRVNLKG